MSFETPNLDAVNRKLREIEEARAAGQPLPPVSVSPETEPESEVVQTEGPDRFRAQAGFDQATWEESGR